ncbi:Twin-arginine translocation protein TatA [Leucobacter sp. 7(1)]|uniref:twin-arginine translocase TatA/TatE family subunit n=1 Tax=Leucobacter sp. 7(1) TaxID=1255613 RepID=UPI00097EFD29|nr:twin-arginine translocase TatA/TatE family subunit [Leucobacter sp. 7(1)]SJN10989.1 Twin-arginine translocation protein TatA [Leucobacter sp. 7(1)]
MFGNLSGPTLLVVLFIVLLLFGAPKLPGLAKSLGQSMRILKKEVRSDNAETGDADAAPSTPAKPAASETSAADEPTPRKSADGDGNDRP